MNIRTRFTLALAACAGFLLAACGGPVDTPHTLSGSVHGGQSPIIGSTIELFTAGTNGPQTDGILADDITTDGNGNWSASYTCPADAPDTPAYVVALGGNPGLASGTNNSAIHLVAALGPCNSIPAHTNINELTTVAAAYALNGFVRSNNIAKSDDSINSSSTNVTGLVNAFATAAQLVDVSTGQPGPAFDGGANVVTEEMLNNLANALAACVNTSSQFSSQCTELFACASANASYTGGVCSGGTSAPPSNTLDAILNIARNPGLVNHDGGIDAIATQKVVFSPTSDYYPNGEALMLNFTGGGLHSGAGIAIDADGNVWTASYANNTVNEFSPVGTPLSGSGFTGGGLDQPEDIAIDASGNIWAVSYGNSSVNKFSPAGTALSPASGFTGGGVGNPTSIAIAPDGNVWVGSFGSETVNEFSPTGTPLSGSGYTGGGVNDVYDIAVDASGNVWAVSRAAFALSEFNPTGTALSPSSGYMGSGHGLTAPEGVAIAPSGNVWVSSTGGVDNVGDPLTEFVGGSTPVSPCPAAPASGDTGCPFAQPTGGYSNGGLLNPKGVAIDARGTVWVASRANNSVNEYVGGDTPPRICPQPGPSDTGCALSPYTGYTGGGLSKPYALAIDASGNVWVENEQSNDSGIWSITEVIGAAAPTRTPLVAAINQGFVP